MKKPEENATTTTPASQPSHSRLPKNSRESNLQRSHSQESGSLESGSLENGSLKNVSDSTLVLKMDIKHEVEREIQRELEHHPDLKFQSLQVFRTANNSVCLQGVVELDETTTDLSAIIRSVTCVENVENRLVAQPPNPELVES